MNLGFAHTLPKPPNRNAKEIKWAYHSKKKRLFVLLRKWIVSERLLTCLRFSLPMFSHFLPFLTVIDSHKSFWTPLHTALLPRVFKRKSKLPELLHSTTMILLCGYFNKSALKKSSTSNVNIHCLWLTSISRYTAKS